MSSTTLPPDGRPSRRRFAAAQRREQLLEVATDLARRDGTGSLTLARVAQAAGVSKPVAYQHFGTLAGLLAAMYERIGAQYEAAVIAPLAERARGADRHHALRALCAAYVDHGLGPGAVHDEVGAALQALDPGDRTARTDVADRYSGLISGVFGIPEEQAYRLSVAFLGSADRLCEAVLAGRMSRDLAVGTLVDLFSPAVPD